MGPGAAGGLVFGLPGALVDDAVVKSKVEADGLGEAFPDKVNALG